MAAITGWRPAVAEINMDDTNFNSPADLLALARSALQAWRKAFPGSAAERNAARVLAFAFAGLDRLGALDEVGRG
jgi:hypothetical protein